ncbi:MAG: DinB family protein [Candidatus Limnocylindrales bacterium]
MYLDALSFLEDERESFRAYEALDALTDEQLDIPVAAAGGWSGRDLMGHVTLWQEAALATARELALGDRSPTMERLEAQWNSAPEAGDVMNEEGIARFRAMSIAEVRELFRNVAGELRGYLTVVPESRWIKHATHQEYFFGEMTEHYEEHQKELRAILEAVA